MLSTPATCRLAFQSTLSVRRATRVFACAGRMLVISIHALREESDARHRVWQTGEVISIHALREESDTQPTVPSGAPYISIHALREESDMAFMQKDDASFISIHALREESDRRPAMRSTRATYFNPRSP